MNLRTLWRAIAFAAALLPAYATAQPAAAPAAASRYAVIPPNKDTDLKLYEANGNVVAGAAALGRMQKDAQLNLWLAGNQFFAMLTVLAIVTGATMWALNKPLHRWLGNAV